MKFTKKEKVDGKVDGKTVLFLFFFLLSFLFIVPENICLSKDLPFFDNTMKILADRASRDLPGKPCFLQPLATGNVLWQFTHSSFDHVRCVRSITDVNGDGIEDALVGIDDLAVSDYDLYCFSGASSGWASTIWAFNSTRGVSGGSGYGDSFLDRFPDVSGDGKEEVLYGTAWGGRTFYALSGANAAELFYYDTYVQEPTSGWIYSVAKINDVTGDGIPDALFGVGSETDAAFCVDGSSNGVATVVWRYDTYDAVFAVASISDVNGDGHDDALVGSGDSYDNRIICIDGNSSGTGVVLWQNSLDDTVYTVAAINDVNSSGEDDALAGTWGNGGNVYCIEGSSIGTGNIIWNQNIGDNVMLVRVIEDVNGDGIDDVLVGSWLNAIICLNGATGGYLWNTPVGTVNGGDVWTIAPIEDVNGDGDMDVLAGSFDLNVYCCDGNNGAILWNYNTGHRIYSVYSIGDVNSDGTPDALAGTQGGNAYIYCIEGDSWVPVEVFSFRAIVE